MSRPESKKLFVVARASGKKLEECAHIAGCSLSTAARWNREPETREEIFSIQMEQYQIIQGQILDIGAEAVATLRELLGPEHPGHVRVNAAARILNELGRVPSGYGLSLLSNEELAKV